MVKIHNHCDVLLSSLPHDGTAEFSLNAPFRGVVPKPLVGLVTYNVVQGRHTNGRGQNRVLIRRDRCVETERLARGRLELHGGHPEILAPKEGAGGLMRDRKKTAESLRAGCRDRRRIRRDDVGNRGARVERVRELRDRLARNPGCNSKPQDDDKGHKPSYLCHGPAIPPALHMRLPTTPFNRGKRLRRIVFRWTDYNLQATHCGG